MAVAVGPLIEAGHPAVVLCSAEARPVLKDLTRADLPRLVVLSQREIPRDTPVEVLGTVVEEEPSRRHVDAPRRSTRSRSGRSGRCDGEPSPTCPEPYRDDSRSRADERTRPTERGR